ncbi:MAG TPA: histidine kinase dimerization/phospho-acceptor domain-containing protein, partial [Kofleriaceae bacterium]
MSPNRLDYEDKQALRAYWTFFAPFRAPILEEIQRAAPEDPHVARLTRDEAEDWRLEHLAINTDAWAPLLERLHQRGHDYARSEMPYEAWYRHLSTLRNRSLQILGEHRDTGAAASAISRGALLVFDINLEMIGRAYFQAKEQAARAQDEQARAALRRSEELLQHSQKMDALGRLAGGVAHDFNNILTVVQSYACMLEEALDDGDVRRQDATEIRRASDRATKLTR